MKKHPKTSFGILEDGLSLKMAHLVRDSYQMYLMSLDKTDLDRPLYQPHEQISQIEEQTWSEDNGSNGEVRLEEFSPDYAPGFKVNPHDGLFNSVRLDKGVIAVNANEDQITRISPPPISKADTKEFLRNNLTPRQLKSREWQTSRVSIGGNEQMWLHKGANQLLELLGSYAKRNHKRLYYQLADANDIALADYYRVNNLCEGQSDQLFYMGKDYRKAFLFDNGNLVDTFPLNIPQELPESELIYARISFALDNAQQAEPGKYVFCGDLASDAVVNHFNTHTPDSAQLLDYPLLVVDSIRGGLYDPSYMAAFALPIALAYKALHPDDERYTRSNFLPGHLIEAQRTFKIAWHGFLILFLIFVVTLLGTINYLNMNQKYMRAKETKRQLDYEYNVLKINTAEVTQMQTDIAQFSKNMDAIRTILVGKNPWSAVLETLNRIFQSKPISWLTNLSKDGTRLKISGFTSNRAHVIDFANSLPNSRIQKVTSSVIHNKTVWSFEITSDFPSVDWVAKIEEEMQTLLDQQRTTQELSSDQLADAPVTGAKPAAEEAELPPAEQTAQIEAPQLPKTIQALTAAAQPSLSPWQQQAGGEAQEDFSAFLAAVESGNLKQVKKLGENYIYRYEGGRLVPLVRWHMANQYFNRGQYLSANSTLEPLTRIVDRHYPYVLLLAARIGHARQDSSSTETYAKLVKDYPGHPAAKQAETDLAIIGKGGGQ